MFYSAEKMFYPKCSIEPFQMFYPGLAYLQYTSSLSLRCQTGMKPYLLYFPCDHYEFRQPEIVALADLFGVKCEVLDSPPASQVQPRP